MLEPVPLGEVVGLLDGLVPVVPVPMLELPFSLLPLQVSEIIFTSVTLKVFSPEAPLEL